MLVLTACGLPMMAGGKGGLAVFYGPTCGYIYGWFFIVLFTGLYAAGGMDKLMHKRFLSGDRGKKTVWNRLLSMSLHLPASFAVGMAGVLLDYVCGSAALAAIGGKSLTELPALLLSNLAFLPGDMVKIGLASGAVPFPFRQARPVPDLPGSAPGPAGVKKEEKRNPFRKPFPEGVPLYGGAAQRRPFPVLERSADLPELLLP